MVESEQRQMGQFPSDETFSPLKNSSFTFFWHLTEEDTEPFEAMEKQYTENFALWTIKKHEFIKTNKQ